MSDEQRKLIYDNQGNPIMEVDEGIDREEQIIQLEEENRLREATAIQVYPFFLQSAVSKKINPITLQLEGVQIDVVTAAGMAWQAADALATVGKMSDKGRAYAPEDTQAKQQEGSIQ